MSGTWDYILPSIVLGGAGICTAAWGTFRTRSGIWGPVDWRGMNACEGSPAVALTFDDGPLPGATDRILDLLGEAGASAAFFVIGQHVRRWPDLVRRMHDEEHIVANHSFDHPHLGLFRGARFWQQQILETDAAIEEVVGCKPAMFRPPMGIRTPAIQQVARSSGHRVINWSKRAKDGVRGQRERILERLLDEVRGGDILMLHDGIDPQLSGVSAKDREATVSALPELIAGIRGRGLGIVGLDRLLGCEAYREMPMAA